MKLSSVDPIRLQSVRAHDKEARASIIILVIVCFLVGLAGGAFLSRSKTNPSTADIEPAAIETPVLSESTKRLLADLSVPVEIRYYSVLDTNAATASLREFSDRVSKLLKEYAAASHGKLTVQQIDPASDSIADQATSDGIRAFFVGEGSTCYLGLVVATADQKEAMSRLTTDWEPALEADLSRAIAKVQSQPRPTATKVDASTVAEVRKRVPDVDSLSLKEATQKLRATAFQEFQAAVNEMSPEITAAQQRIRELETNGSKAELDAARQELRELQKQQTARLQEITQQLSQEIEALQQLKETSSQ